MSELIDFYFPDPAPGTELRDIFPISIRAKAWLARASSLNDFQLERSVQIAGAVSILSGLDYHYEQFMGYYTDLGPYYDRHSAHIRNAISGKSHDTEISPLPTVNERAQLDALDHEAVAYLNRLGQFFQFAESIKLAGALPRAKELQIFRHKHTAHRSIDKPQNDPSELQREHAMAFNFYRLTVGMFPIYQIRDKRGRYYVFHMRADHPIVMEEAMNLFQAIHTLP